MKRISLLNAVYVIAAILLAAHSYHNEYAELQERSRWFRTIGYGLGPWLCAFAFAGAKWAFQMLLRRQPSGFQDTFQWVTGVVIGLMIITKIIS